ncbi:MAG: type I-C CRISPR-associated protein Cas5c [Planctomycetes bacterium]|nr:type I-C CRISPR-associated protein Cas5c [Planctomycetota bacterium]
MSSTVSVKVWGEWACFTRPELKVERMSYLAMTPSAARGVLEALVWKPQMRWHVRRIDILRPPHLMGVRRNEIQDKIAPRTVGEWMSDPTAFEPYLVDSAGRESVGGQNRTQRNTIALRNVAYVIHATPLLTRKANKPRERPPDEDENGGPDTVAKYVAMFQRRVARGQCFHRPYLGCREFFAHFGPAGDDDRPIDWTADLGWMLYDLDFGADGRNTPGFFAAQITRGVLHCDRLAPGPNGEAPIQVFGWSEPKQKEPIK